MLSGLLENPSFREQFGDPNDVITGITVSSYCLAFTLAHLIVGRIITGLGTGIDSSTVPMYQSELSKREWRGRLVSWEILFIGIGIVLVSNPR